jgi:hypothetical protein
VSCIDLKKRWAVWSRLACLGVVAGCASSTSEPPAVVGAASRATSSSSTTASTSTSKAGTTGTLPAPSTMRNWTDVRAQAARRLVAANPSGTYTGTGPDILLASPVLEVELNGDGSVRRIDVLRQPRQAVDTVKLATDAVQRAAPFGDVSRLPKPWRFTETFLFNDDRKFKPRTLDQ